MNKERLALIADTIEHHIIPDLGFNMGVVMTSHNLNYYKDKSNHNCGTVACIAGHALAMFGNADYKSIESRLGTEEASQLLDITDDQADLLFYGPELDYDNNLDENFELSDITAKQAVDTIRHFIETGEVNWQL